MKHLILAAFIFWFVALYPLWYGMHRQWLIFMRTMTGRLALGVGIDAAELNGARTWSLWQWYCKGVARGII